MKFIAPFLLLVLILMPIKGFTQVIPDTTSETYTQLDPNNHIPYYSFASSRGDEWLVGNSNQLFHVSKDATYDLVPQLKEHGYLSIRKVATDGRSWLILGDTTLWNSKPDLAFLYDGIYLKDISEILYNIPDHEWIGNISGKQGLWLITTDKNIYLWHNALANIMPLELPQAFKEPRVSDIELIPVAKGWLLSFIQQNGPKSISHGYPLFDRRVFFYDGETTQETTSLYKNISSLSAIGSNGKKAIFIGAIFSAEKLAPEYAYFESTGLDVKQMPLPNNNIFNNSLPAQRQPFLSNGKITWSGTSWIMHDNKNVAEFFNNTQLNSYHQNNFTIINSGYGAGNNALLVGYQIQKNTITPRMENYFIKK